MRNSHRSWSAKEALLDAGSTFFTTLAALYTVGLTEWRAPFIAAGIQAGISFFRHNHRVNSEAR